MRSKPSIIIFKREPHARWKSVIKKNIDATKENDSQPTLL
jgi:hypothetical protein